MKAINMYLFTILICCSVFSNIVATDDSPPSVTVSQGKITGVILQSTLGRDYAAFMGIPYGEVTKRFDVPQPARPWTGNLKATGIKISQICYQYEPFIIKDIIGTEDCLKLNVYTPNLPKSSDDEMLPVMVYIYGGAFVTGFNLPLVYGPQHLMDKDVVLVLMNYRIGFLGFLSTGDDAAQGNAGLWDQRLALQWVQENIVVFGGDKNRVTIFGESAGAASVTYHLLSPQSAGLFHGAIIQSGSALCSWALVEQPLDNAIFLANKLNCSTQSTHDLVECLRTKDSEDILNVNALLNFKVGPVVELGSKPKFLPDHPYVMLQHGKFNKVPVIIGVVLDEGAAFFKYVKQYFNCTKDEFLKHGLKKALKYFSDDDFTEFYLGDMSVYNEIVDVYYKNMEQPADAFIEGIEMVGDICFNGCANTTITLLTAHDIPVFSYVFEYISNLPIGTNYTGKLDVFHTSELKYLFNPTVFQINYTVEDLEFISSLVTMWTKFAELGDPTPDGSVSWMPISRNGNQFLRIGRDMRMDENYIPERLNVSSKFNKAYMDYQLA